MEFTTEARILRGVGGLYLIKLADDAAHSEKYTAVSPLAGRSVLCRARGSIRGGGKLMVGDLVTVTYSESSFEMTADGAVPRDDSAGLPDMAISSILPRKNALIRPPLANLDFIFILCASAAPAPAPETIDKLLSVAEYHGIEAALIIGKNELDSEKAAELERIYTLAGYSVFSLSCVTGDGIERLEKFIDGALVGKISAFAGASGVGKSTLMSRLFPSLALETGEISRRTERGKHTTRTAELFPIAVGDGETHKMRYEVLDFAGNKSSMTFSLRGRRNKALGKKAQPAGELVDRERTWVKDTLGVEVLIPRHGLFDDTYVSISRNNRGPNLPPSFSIGNPNVALRKPMTLTIPVPERWKGMGRKVFVGQMGAKSLTYIGGEMSVDTGARGVNVIEAKVSQFGTYTLGIDSIAPSVRINNKGNALGRDSWIYIGVSDGQSGIANYSVWIDNRWEVFEYDYKNSRLKGKISYLGIGRGKHTLRVRVEDSCGNSAERTWAFGVN